MPGWYRIGLRYLLDPEVSVPVQPCRQHSGRLHLPPTGEISIGIAFAGRHCMQIQLW
jgi:citrate lyase alpha subunit